MSRRIPVVYILSNGHSGSTLLDLLLGLHPQIWTLGEAQFLPWEVKKNLQPCGCGTAIEQCSFWEPILSLIPLYEGTYPIAYFRESENFGKVLRWPHIYEIMRRQMSSEHKAAAAEYGQVNYRYFQTVWEAAERLRENEIRYLVDDSKDMYRLQWLMQSEGFDLYVIHLLKDPRAFVYSMTKSDPSSARRTVRMAGRWLFENMVYAHMSADPSLAGKTMRIRYEDMASDPKDILARLGEWLGLDFADLVLDGYETHESHGISGNLIRMRRTYIELDERWRRSLPPSTASLVWTMTRAGAARFGYKRDS